jgi:hypothetical protein
MRAIMAINPALCDRTEKKRHLRPHFTLGTANSAGFKLISVQISGFRDKPVKYLDPEWKRYNQTVQR